MAGVKALSGGGEGPFVELFIPHPEHKSFPITTNLRPNEARHLAARLYIAARAAERIAAKEAP